MDRDIKDKGNKDMYLKAFDGKRNGATVQRGVFFGPAVGGGAAGFDLGDGGLYGLSGIGPLGQPACGACRAAGKCALYGAVLCEKGSFKLTSTEVAGIAGEGRRAVSVSG